MLKYEMTIDGKEYKALFADHFEAADFIDEVEREDGSEVIVHGYREMTIADILSDSDFSESYAIEMIGVMVLPNIHDFKKTFEIRLELERLGVLS